MAKKSKVPAMPAPEKQEEFTGPLAPVEIIFHLAGVNIEKVDTLGGTMTVLSLMSPTGFAVTVRLSDDDVDKIVSQLKGIHIVTSSGLLS